MAVLFTSSITRKQVGVIYSKAKAGELKVERWVMAEFYDIAGYDDIDWNGSKARLESVTRKILEVVFSGDMEKAQKAIDEYTEYNWKIMGKKSKARANRAIVA